MSFLVSKVQEFPQSTLQNIPQNEYNTVSITGLPLLGGLLSNGRYAWHAKGPCLEVRDTKTGSKVGAWTFGCILKDSNTRVVCVEEIRRAYGRLSLLAVGIECTISGGLICIFDAFISKVLRAIQIKKRISNLHVVDSGLEVLNLPGSLHEFDGILAVGTEGGNVYLIDMCRQICEESMLNVTLRDELYPSEISILAPKNMPRIEHFRECAVRNGNHLAIHLNLVLHSQTEHFTLKGPNNEDRLFVNKEEVIVSALFYCPQLTSLLVGFNFGAFQIWNLTNLTLIYTSPVCDEHLPITHFTFQEPTDDPRAFCYIWVSYSRMDLYQNGLPFAVMYSICYENKEYHEGYGYLYQDFQHCSIRFQIELGSIEENRCGTPPKGALCLGFQPIYKQPANKELYTNHVVGDTLALCLISWTVWFSEGETETNMLIFDLNQWYKEQMPSFTKWKNCTNFLLNVNVSELILHSGRKPVTLLNILVDEKTLSQFVGVNRLEEHFYPTSLSFDMWTLRESDVILIRNEGLQKSLLHQIESAGPLCLIRPTDIFKQLIKLGLAPLFVYITSSVENSVDFQREIILDVGLEYQLIGWLCKCASEWANGSFSSAGCSLDFLYNWAFQRAITLKTNCDKYCTPLFDYSQSRLDNNTSVLLHSCTRQINNLCTFYVYVQSNLPNFISSLESVTEQYTILEMVSIYFEVLQWLVNVGLLPEGHPSAYPRADQFDRISAPYPVQELVEFYNEKRAQLCLLSKENFASNDSLLFIDNLIENKCGAEQLQKQWQEDGGSGLYPPPSLQSMLRTYLVQGTSISHKHSLIIYVFLDLAMALDQTKYSGVITHLIKFPAVFKVSPSIIKITQAFWQLDHGDYTTAIEQLLDPFVLGDDLQPWHHTIALRALLLQDQYNLALLYMQIRKPPIIDEKDVLTAISLFVANNMLDEAFYFERQHRNINNEEKLLTHFFNECNKNKSLYNLLFKYLNTDEEETFFNYLKSVNNPTSDDIQVFYYLLRSRFIEAFDVHSNTKRKNPENQGLIGQRNATTTDQIVKIFKTSLPAVNKNIVDYIRKERINIWKSVSTPTPLSVFVHDTKEHIHYKSTIHAVLAKAKNIFADNIDGSRVRELTTEETPFLRTPTALKKISRFATPIIMSKVIEIGESGEKMGPTPSKRIKLTPRASSNISTYNYLSVHSTMLTPIVKRETSLQQNQSGISNGNIGTPQSILKVRRLVKNNESITEDTFLDEEFDSIARKEISQRSSLGLLPRKSLMKTSKRSHVQFRDAARFSLSYSDQSTQQAEIPSIENQILQKSSLSSKDISCMLSSKSSSTGDETFYSPNASANELSKEKLSEFVTDGTNEKVLEIDTVENKNEEINVASNVAEIQIMGSKIASPRARRSYKRPFVEVEVRSSPRLAEKCVNLSHDTSNAQNIVTTSTTSTSISNNLSVTENVSNHPSRILENLKGRKSLSRKVLEHNTFVKKLSVEQVIYNELSVSKTENTAIVQKSPDTLKTTSVNTSLNISNVSTLTSSNAESTKSDNVTHSILTKSFIEKSIVTDSFSEVNDNMDFTPFPQDVKSTDSLEERNSPILNENESIEENLVEEQQNVGMVLENSNCSIDVYEDLSSGTEDIEDVLKKSRNAIEEHQSNISHYSESEVLNESSYCLAETELAFIEDQSKIDDKAESVISISSDDADESRHSTTDSQRTERLDNLSVSFESSNQTSLEQDDNSWCNTPKRSFSSSDTRSLADNEDFMDMAVIIEEPVQDIELNEINNVTEHSEENKEIDGFEIMELVQDIRMPSIQHEEEKAAIPQLTEEEILKVSTETNQCDTVEMKGNEEIDDIYEQGKINKENVFPTGEELIKQENLTEVSRENAIVSDNILKEAEEIDDTLLLVDLQENVKCISKSPDHEASAGSVIISMAEDNNIKDQKTLCQTKTLIRQENLTEVSGESAIVSDNILKKAEEIDNPLLLVDLQENVKCISKSPDHEASAGSVIISMAEDNKIKDQEILCQTKTLTKQENFTEVSGENAIVSDNIFKKAEEIYNPILLVDSQENVKCFSKSPDHEATAGSVIISMTEDNKIKDQKTLAEESEKEQENINKDIEKQYASESLIDEINKKNQSTNTTDMRVNITNQNLSISTLHNSPTRVEQSTNTTVLFVDDEKVVEKSIPTKLQSSEGSNEYNLNIALQKPIFFDQNTSSSDTTESDAQEQEIIVTAQIHTPRRKKIEEPLIKRITRRNSALFSQNMEKDHDENIFLADASIKLDCSVDMTKHQISPSIDLLDRVSESPTTTLTPVRTIQTRRYSHSSVTKSDKIDCDLNESKHIIELPKEVKNRLRKTRSASVDEVKTYSRKRSLRTSSMEGSIDETMEEHKQTRRGKARSVSQMSVISEEHKFDKKAKVPQKKIDCNIDTYSTSRRLTRKQASILKSINTPTTVTAEDDSDTDQSHETDIFDPIQLLDKEPFEGKPDSDEEKVFSSPTSSTVSSFSKPTRRQSRSASIVSDSSIHQSEGQLLMTPTKKKKSKEHADNKTSGRVRTSTRRQSETGSVTSEKSIPTTPKRVKKKEFDVTSDAVSRSTRSRTASISSIKSDTAQSSKKTRSSRLISAKSDLPEISEEKINEDKKITSKRVARKKSSQ